MRWIVLSRKTQPTHEIPSLPPSYGTLTQHLPSLPPSLSMRYLFASLFALSLAPPIQFLRQQIIIKTNYISYYTVLLLSVLWYCTYNIQWVVVLRDGLNWMSVCRSTWKKKNLASFLLVLLWLRRDAAAIDFTSLSRSSDNNVWMRKMKHGWLAGWLSRSRSRLIDRSINQAINQSIGTF